MQPLNSIPVKYYIYKGIDKDFLIDNSNPTHIADANKSDLTKIIQTSQSKRNEAYDKLKGNTPGTTTTPAKLSAVGLNLTSSANSPNNFPDNAKIDEVYLRIDWDEFPSVNGGDDLGEFISENFGFEIVLDGLGESPTLDIVRNDETIITVNTNLSGEVNKFKTEDKREQILHYIDPCAFFANFFFVGIHVKSHANSSSFVPKKDETLYNDVLSLFYTKDIIYLDIRNEHNHGLNYYQNYNNPPNEFANFYISFDEEGDELKEYQYINPLPPNSLYKWPIFPISTGVFSNSNSKIPSTITIQLPSGDNPKPAVYLTQGYYYTGFRKMYERPKTNSPLRDNLFFQNDYTVSIKLSIPKLDDNTTIPFYVNIRYLKRNPFTKPNPPSGILTLQSENYVDNLFELTRLMKNDGTLKIPLQNNDIIKWQVTNNLAYIDMKPEVNNLTSMVKIGIGEDISNIYFFAVQKESNIITNSKNSTLQLPNTITNEYANPEFNNQYYRQDITDSNNNSISIVTTHDLPNDFYQNPLHPKPVNDVLNWKNNGKFLTFIALDKNTDLPKLVAAISNFESAYDKRIVLRNKKSKVDETSQFHYEEYDLDLEGYKFNSTVEVEVSQIQTGIKVRNYDFYPKIFSSNVAAQNFNSLDSIEGNKKNFENSYLQRDVILNVRSTPTTQVNNVVFCLKGWCTFTILEKKKKNNNQTWYHIEWEDGLVGLKAGSIDQPQVAPSSPNNKGWVRPNLSDNDVFDKVVHPVASFEKFMKDFYLLSQDLDSQPDSQGDTLIQRITRIRQRTKEGGDISDLFDDLITHTGTLPDPPIRLNDLYNGIPAGTSSDLKLFVDYMQVKLSNHKIIDLHHLFIGLDVLNFPRTDFNVTLYYIISIHIPNNIDYYTWAGDIGAAPADYITGQDGNYRDDWQEIHPNASSTEKQKAFLEHYYKTRSSKVDLLSDVYIHLLHDQFNKYLLHNTSFNDIPATLYYFNLSIKDNDKRAFHEFFKYLQINPSIIPFSNQITLLDNVIDKIHSFSILWYRNKNTPFHGSPSPQIDTKLEDISTLYSLRFLLWLQKNK